jgi:hypothetical protein
MIIGGHMSSDPSYLIGAFGVALLATLTLAAAFTPRQWWKRPNARALVILVGGTWAIGSLVVSLAHHTDPLPPPTGPALAHATPLIAGHSYQAHEDLNLRSAGSVGSPRVAVVPGGALVVATGARDGDWWQVKAKVGTRTHTGWASSLWLRRTEESKPE